MGHKGVGAFEGKSAVLCLDFLDCSDFFHGCMVKAIYSGKGLILLLAKVHVTF